MNRYRVLAEFERVAWEASEQNRRIREDDKKIAAALAAQAVSRQMVKGPSDQQRMQLQRFLDKPGARGYFVVYP